MTISVSLTVTVCGRQIFRARWEVDLAKTVVLCRPCNILMNKISLEIRIFYLQLPYLLVASWSLALRALEGANVASKSRRNDLIAKSKITWPVAGPGLSLILSNRRHFSSQNNNLRLFWSRWRKLITFGFGEWKSFTEISTIGAITSTMIPTP